MSEALIPAGGAVEAGEGHPCPHCRRRLADRNGLYCHVAQAHGHRKARLAVPDHPSVVRERLRRERAQRDRTEPSMADLAIEASIARAMGEAVDPDIAEMFDV